MTTSTASVHSPQESSFYKWPGLLVVSPRCDPSNLTNHRRIHDQAAVCGSSQPTLSPKLFDCTSVPHTYIYMYSILPVKKPSTSSTLACVLFRIIYISNLHGSARPSSPSLNNPHGSAEATIQNGYLPLLSLQKEP